MNSPTFKVVAALERSRDGKSNTDELMFIVADASFVTEQDARAFAALFPKSYGVRSGNLGGTPGFTGWVSIRATLGSNGVNGGSNEVGLARMKKFLSKLVQLNGTWEIKEERWLNAASVARVMRELGTEISAVLPSA